MKDLEGKNILIIGASKGFDLISDTMTILKDGNADRIVRDRYHHYDKPYIFLRDVDVEPIVLESEEIFEQNSKI